MKRRKQYTKEFRREVLKQMITDLRADGWSLRQIGDHVGLHFTRVGQLLNSTDSRA